MPNRPTGPPGTPPQRRRVPGGARAALIALVGSTALAVALIGDIRTDEGRVYHAYRDIAGIVTGCDGDTNDVHMGQTFNDAECDERTARQLVNHARPVMACVPALRQVGHENQLRASVRFAYNVGVSAFCRSSVANRMNAGNWRGGCDAMLLYDKVRVGGVLRPVRGLTLRRQRDRLTCLRGL